MFLGGAKQIDFAAPQTNARGTRSIRLDAPGAAMAIYTLMGVTRMVLK